MSNTRGTMSVPERVRRSLNDKEYRHSYAEEFLNTWIATQIKVLREQRNWKQSDLAREAGMKQSAISRLENMNYSSWSLSTLKRLAYAFDVRVKVSFETFGSLISEFAHFGAESLQRADYANDPTFSEVSMRQNLLAHEVLRDRLRQWLMLNSSLSNLSRQTLALASKQKPIVIELTSSMWGTGPHREEPSYAELNSICNNPIPQAAKIPAANATASGSIPLISQIRA